MKPASLGIVLAVFLLGCAAPAGPAGPAPADVTVELDAYSGRPNPVWTLSRDEAAEFAARLRDLPPAGQRLPDPVLGCRGFRVRNPGGEGGIPADVYVSAAGLIQVAADESGGGPLYRDARGAEAWLVAQARARGRAGVFGGP